MRIRSTLASLAALVLAEACGGTTPVEDDGGNVDAGSGGSDSGGSAQGGSSNAGASGDSASGGTSGTPAMGMQVLYEGEDDPSVIALDDRFVYWGSSEGLRRAPLDGGPPVSLVPTENIL